MTTRLWEKITHSTVRLSFYLKILGMRSLPRPLGKKGKMFYGASAGVAESSSFEDKACFY